MNETLSKISLALAALLLICLFPMPYGCYTIVRFIAMVVFACMAYSYYRSSDITLAVVFGALALLFQPFVKIVLGRGVWHIVDIIVAVGLLVLWKKKH